MIEDIFMYLKGKQYVGLGKPSNPGVSRCLVFDDGHRLEIEPLTDDIGISFVLWSNDPMEGGEIIAEQYDEF